MLHFLVSETFNHIPDYTLYMYFSETKSSDDENNLLYVAVTRAKKALILPANIITLLGKAGVSKRKNVLADTSSFLTGPALLTNAIEYSQGQRCAIYLQSLG
jgi:ATP-dependent exoDNAse (exonuclease V) beta subunit